ncbi:hypothetical protein QSD55_001464, partial [Escherichia coli]
LRNRERGMANIDDFEQILFPPVKQLVYSNAVVLACFESKCNGFYCFTKILHVIVHVCQKSIYI